MTPAINAARQAGITYTIHEYRHDPSHSSYGLEAAEKMGVEPTRVFKTLIVATETRELLVGIVPVTMEIFNW